MMSERAFRRQINEICYEDMDLKTKKRLLRELKKDVRSHYNDQKYSVGKGLISWCVNAHARGNKTLTARRERLADEKRAVERTKQEILRAADRAILVVPEIQTEIEQHKKAIEKFGSAHVAFLCAAVAYYDNALDRRETERIRGVFREYHERRHYTTAGEHKAAFDAGYDEFVKWHQKGRENEQFYHQIVFPRVLTILDNLMEKAADGEREAIADHLRSIAEADEREDLSEWALLDLIGHYWNLNGDQESAKTVFKRLNRIYGETAAIEITLSHLDSELSVIPKRPMHSEYGLETELRVRVPYGKITALWNTLFVVVSLPFILASAWFLVVPIAYFTFTLLRFIMRCVLYGQYPGKARYSRALDVYERDMTLRQATLQRQASLDERLRVLRASGDVNVQDEYLHRLLFIAFEGHCKDQRGSSERLACLEPQSVELVRRKVA